jgi:hypothetical protein
MNQNSSINIYAPNAYAPENTSETHVIENVEFGYISDEKARYQAKYSCNIPQHLWGGCSGYIESGKCTLCGGTGPANCRTHDGLIELPFGTHVIPTAFSTIDKLVKITCCLCSKPLVCADGTGTASVSRLCVGDNKWRQSALSPLMELWDKCHMDIYDYHTEKCSSAIGLPYDQHNLNLLLFLLGTPLEDVLRKSFKSNPSPIPLCYKRKNNKKEKVEITADVVCAVHCSRGEKRQTLRRLAASGKLGSGLEHVRLHSNTTSCPPEPGGPFPIEFTDVGEGNMNFVNNDILDVSHLCHGVLPFIPGGIFSRASLDEGKYEDWKRCIQLRRVDRQWTEEHFRMWDDWGIRLEEWASSYLAEKAGTVVRDRLLGSLGGTSKLLCADTFRLPLVLVWVRARTWAISLLRQYTCLGLFRCKNDLKVQIQTYETRGNELDLWTRSSRSVLHLIKNAMDVKEITDNIEQASKKHEKYAQSISLVRRQLQIVREWIRYALWTQHIWALRMFQPEGAVVHGHAERLLLQKWVHDRVQTKKRKHKTNKTTTVKKYKGKTNSSRRTIQQKIQTRLSTIPPPAPSRWGFEDEPSITNWIMVKKEPVFSNVSSTHPPNSDDAMDICPPEKEHSNPDIKDFPGDWDLSTLEEQYELFSVCDPAILQQYNMGSLRYRKNMCTLEYARALQKVARKAPSLSTWRTEFRRAQKISKWLVHSEISKVLSNFPENRRSQDLSILNKRVLAQKKPMGDDIKTWKARFSSVVTGVLEPVELLAVGPRMHPKHAMSMRMKKVYPLLSATDSTSAQILKRLERIRADCTTNIRPEKQLTCESLFGGCGATQWQYHDTRDMQQILYFIMNEGPDPPQPLHPQLKTPTRRRNCEFIKIHVAHVQELLSHVPRRTLQTLGITNKRNDPRNAIRNTVIWPPTALTLSPQEVGEYIIRTGSAYNDLPRSNTLPVLKNFQHLAVVAQEQRLRRLRWEKTNKHYISAVESLFHFPNDNEVVKLIALCLARRQQINKFMKLPLVVNRKFPHGHAKDFWGDVPVFGDKLYGKDGHLRDSVLRRSVNGSAWATLGHSPSQKTTDVKVCSDYVGSSAKTCVVTQEKLLDIQTQLKKVKKNNREHQVQRTKLIHDQLLSGKSAWATNRNKYELAGLYAWGCNVWVQGGHSKDSVDYRNNRFTNVSVGDMVTSPVRDGTIVTCVRHPVLNDNSIQCMSSTVNRTQNGFRIATLTCQPLAGDADGDSLNINNNMNDTNGEWGEETARLFGSHTHATRDIDGGTLYSVVQDGMLGVNLLSRGMYAFPKELVAGVLRTVYGREFDTRAFLGQHPAIIPTRYLIEHMLPGDLNYNSYDQKTGNGVVIRNSKFVRATNETVPVTYTRYSNWILQSNTHIPGQFTSEDMNGKPGSIIHLVAHLCGRATMILFVERLYLLSSTVLCWYGIGITPADCLIPCVTDPPKNPPPPNQPSAYYKFVETRQKTHITRLGQWVRREQNNPDVADQNHLALLCAVGCKASLSDIMQLTQELGQEVQSGELPSLISGRSSSQYPYQEGNSVLRRGYILSSFQEGLRPRNEILVHSVSAISKERASSLSVSAPGNLQQKMTWTLSMIRTGPKGALIQTCREKSRSDFLYVSRSPGWKMCLLVRVRLSEAPLKKQMGLLRVHQMSVAAHEIVKHLRTPIAWVPCDPERVLRRVWQQLDRAERISPVYNDNGTWGAYKIEQMWFVLLQLMSSSWGGTFQEWVLVHPLWIAVLVPFFNLESLPSSRHGYLFCCRVLARYKRALHKEGDYVGQRTAGQLAKKVLQLALDVRHAKFGGHVYDTILVKVNQIIGNMCSPNLQWLRVRLKDGCDNTFLDGIGQLKRDEWCPKVHFFSSVQSMTRKCLPSDWDSWLRIDPNLISQICPDNQVELLKTQPVVWLYFSLPAPMTAAHLLSRVCSWLPQNCTVGIWHSPPHPSQPLQWGIAMQTKPVNQLKEVDGITYRQCSSSSLVRMARFICRYILPITNWQLITPNSDNEYQIHWTPRKIFQWTPPSNIRIIKILTLPYFQNTLAGDSIGCPFLVGQIFGIHALQRCLWNRFTEAFDLNNTSNQNITRLLSRVMSYYGYKAQMRAISESTLRKLLQGRNHLVANQAAINGNKTWTTDGFESLIVGRV